MDRSPVLRADLVNLVDKIQHDTPLPISAYMEANRPISAFDYGIVSLDPSTGNGFGGVELPQAAAPLGLYRGVELSCLGFSDRDFDITNSYHYAPRQRGAAT